MVVGRRHLDKIQSLRKRGAGPLRRHLDVQMNYKLSGCMPNAIASWTAMENLEGAFNDMLASFIDLLMGLFRGAVFRHGGGALKQPIKDPTETPTSTLALMGRFPSLMGRFPTLMGRFADFVLRGRFTS